MIILALEVVAAYWVNPYSLPLKLSSPAHTSTWRSENQPSWYVLGPLKHILCQ